ncbi:MAG: GntR family transcriptional regulator [Janthinobacterium lividum]
MAKEPLPAGVLDRGEGRPLYHQLKRWISGQIASGHFPPGSRLPDEQQLSGSLGVSRGVVRQAMSELAFEGLVSKQQGRGTFVAEPKVEARLMSQLPGLAADAAAHGQTVSSHVLGLAEVPAGEVVAQSLKIAEGTPVVRLERLRSIDGEPLALAVTYLPSALAGGLLDVDLEGEVSLYGVLAREFDLPVVGARRRVEAAVAGAREARLLTLRRGAPLLVLRSVSHTTGGRPLEYFSALHRGDRCAFSASLPVGDTSPMTLLTGPVPPLL